MVDFFKNLTFFFVPLNFGLKRIQFFENQIRNFGGSVVKNKTEITHVVIEDYTANSCTESLSSALKNYGFNATKSIKYVKASWLSACLIQKKVVDTDSFEVEWMEEEKNLEDKNIYKINDLEDGSGSEEESPSKKQKVEHEKFICSVPSTSYQGDTSETKDIIVKELQKLADAYAIRKETWKSHAYRKAATAVRLCNKEITKYEDACRIPGVGEKMALKIMEIIELGKLSKAEDIMDGKTKTLDIFCKVWGAGPSTAETWYAQGYRNLEDLTKNSKLTKQQQIGLKFYYDLQIRIPRTEIEQIKEIVAKEIYKIHSSLNIELVGSYRRGKTTCGDVDFMIVNPDVKSPLEILLALTNALKAQGYLVDDLVFSENSDGENHHKKYFGIFKLHGENQIHRRIDFFVVPQSEYATALVNYTGSALFNRSMKCLARKKGMSLTAHGLFTGTIRKGSEVTCKGQLIPTLTEKDVFKELGLPYKLPEERDH